VDTNLTYDQTRFRELLLYIAEQSLDDPRFGKTKLAKILFFSDFAAYAHLGKSITGAVYVHRPRGPMPRSFYRELESLQDIGDAVVARKRYYTQDQERLVARREADLSRFTPEEIALVDHVIAELRDMNASEVSDLSHLEAAWRFVDAGSDIPYDLVFVSTEPPSPEATARVQAVAKQRGFMEASAPVA
jgi:hypothetical protein